MRLKYSKILVTTIFFLISNYVIAQDNSAFVSQSIPSKIGSGESFSVVVTFKNTGTTTWTIVDMFRLGSQNPQDNHTWGLNRVLLPNDVSPGETVDFNIIIKAPVANDIFFMQWKMVHDGVAWFGEASDIFTIEVGDWQGTLSDSLLTITPTPFSVSSHVVGTSLFHWYNKNQGQLSSPWVALEGRDKWTGDVMFWKAMIMQVMAANIDVMYVLVIPTMEEERIRLFQALNELRREGWNVPKVSPFFDPIITYTIKGVNGDASTEAGKDEIIGHYIRFYKQYFSVNTDTYADDFIYSQDGKPVLDAWHVHLHIDNYDQLTRDDVESRLIEEFGLEHPLFFNGIKMITTASESTFSFADEQVYQFQVHEYYKESTKNGILSSQIKPGYWDQNVRNPGYLLPRDGGVNYTNAWNQLSFGVDRVYIESFNEYDEGSGLYASRIDTIYKKTDGGMNNTGDDVWSISNNPYEYIKTTYEGAKLFNDYQNLESKIIWHNIPSILEKNQVYNATILVRNEGNEMWSNASGFYFGQNESKDVVHFGPMRYSIDDTKDNIPDFGGIFRGRVKIFNIEITAPNSIGDYITHWGMLQDGVAWFGEEIVYDIKVVEEGLHNSSSNEMFQMVIYPNPALNNGNVYVEGGFIAKDEISIISTTGEIVFSKKIKNKLDHISLKPISINQGIYIIKIKRNDKTIIGRILIKN